MSLGNTGPSDRTLAGLALAEGLTQSPFLICRREGRHAGDPRPQGRGQPGDGGAGATGWKGESQTWVWGRWGHARAISVSGLALLTLPTTAPGGPSAGLGQRTEPGPGAAAERESAGGASL